jgi:hypothetical protein
MCFSATASFTVAAVTASLGIATLAKVRAAREIPFAVVPLLFAAQQATEGVLWLLLDDGGGGPAVAAAATGYLIFAKVAWPALTPAAVLLIEPDRVRRSALLAIAVVGPVLGLALLAGLVAEGPAVSIHRHSLLYGSGGGDFLWLNAPYLVCTCGPLLLSSHRIVRAFGAVVLAGFAASIYAYYTTALSVWCFFAAAGSTLVYLHFARAAAEASVKGVPQTPR